MPPRELSLAPDAAWQKGDIILLKRPADPRLIGSFLVVTKPLSRGGVGYLAVITPVGLRVGVPGSLTFHVAGFDDGPVVGNIPDPKGALARAKPKPRVACPPGDFYEHRWGDGA